MQEKVKTVVKKLQEKISAFKTRVCDVRKKFTKENLYWLVPALIIIVGFGILFTTPKQRVAEAPTNDDGEIVQISEKRDVSVVGTYVSGWLPAASSPGREFTLTLSEDGIATFTGDYKNGQKLVTEAGTWTQEGDRITVTIDSRFDFEIDVPVSHVFVVSENTLTLTDFSTTRWGTMGLTLKKSQ